MSLYRHQKSWDPCRRGSFSSGSCYGGSGKRICYYPSYGRCYYPQTYWGGYGRSCFPPIYYGGGYGYGRRYGLGYGSRRGSICYDPCRWYGSRRGSICYDPCSYGSVVCYPRSRRYSCSSIGGPC